MESKKEINCICGEKAQLIVKDTKMFGGRIIIRNDRMYKCKRGHKFLTSEQMREFEKKFRERFFLKKKVIETGRSLAITISPDFAEFYGLKKGSKVTIAPNGKKEAILRFGD